MITIIGAGMAGLLAANMLATSSHVTIYEAQPHLPNNHHAVLRFRSSAVGDVLGIPFRKVMMIKATQSTGNAAADALRYSSKAFGEYRSDRSLPLTPIFEERFIAPSDLISRMAQQAEERDVQIAYGTLLQSGTAGLTFKQASRELPVHDGPFISTIPMPALMELLDYPMQVTFTHMHGSVIRANVIKADAFATLYTPKHEYISRISITGSELIIELPRVPANIGEAAARNHLNWASQQIGISLNDIDGMEIVDQRYSKIAPIDERVRRDFLHWATDKHNVFSLGRYATWRPGLLLDDLVNDVRLIASWTLGGDRYSVQRHR